MQMRFFSRLGATIAMTLIASCSAKSAAPFPDVASFCQAKAQAECQMASTCALDVGDCQTERASVCNAAAETAMTSGSHARTYTQANAAACINAVNSAYASTQIAFNLLYGSGSIDDLCQRVFSGNAASNDPCQSPYDCTGNDVCSPVFPGQSMLVCASPVAKSAGDFCEDPGSTCMTDTYCGMPATGGGYQCEAAKQQGEACDPVAMPCVSADRCETGGASGATCALRVAPGQPCQSNDDCSPAAPFCDPYVSICTAGLSFATLAPDCSEFKLQPAGDAGVN